MAEKSGVRIVDALDDVFGTYCKFRDEEFGIHNKVMVSRNTDYETICSFPVPMFS